MLCCFVYHDLWTILIIRLFKQSNLIPRSHCLFLYLWLRSRNRTGWTRFHYMFDFFLILFFGRRLFLYTLFPLLFFCERFFFFNKLVDLINIILNKFLILFIHNLVLFFLSGTFFWRKMFFLL